MPREVNQVMTQNGNVGRYCWIHIPTGEVGETTFKETFRGVESAAQDAQMFRAARFIDDTIPRSHALQIVNYWNRQHGSGYRYWIE